MSFICMLISLFSFDSDVWTKEERRLTYNNAATSRWSESQNKRPGANGAIVSAVSGAGKSGCHLKVLSERLPDGNLHE